MRAILPRTPGRTPAASTAPALFPTGEIVGRYRVEAVIGLGGTGTVFRCFDKERGSLVAVKAIPHDATLRRRAQREVEVARRLDHPNVVRLLDSARDDDYIYVVSELVDGGDLGASLRAGALGDAALLRAVSATCAGLAHAHASGIVHRDVKPANILLGGDGTVQLADFGIAMLVGPDATIDDRLLGTLSYMAPEICTGATPTPAADIWSIGVMLYEAMTGANPFRSRSPAELADRHGERLRPLAEVRPDLGKPLAAACARALSRDPRRRPTAASLATVFEAAANRLESPAGSRVVELRPRPARAPRRLPGPRMRLAVPRVHRPSVRTPARSLPSIRRALGATASTLVATGIPAPLAVRACAIARGGGPGVAAVVVVEAMLRSFPFWPPSLTTPMALTCGALALAAPWSAAALVLAVCIPGLGNLSSAVAWACALFGVLWLGSSVGSGRRALLPAFAPAALDALAFPAYLTADGRLRSAPGRFLAGAAGPLAIALWAAHGGAETYAGTGDAALVVRELIHGAGAPLLGQSIGWGAVAMAWPLAWSGWRIGRAAALCVWLGLALAAQAVIPAALGAAPEPSLRSLAAVSAAAILIGLSVPARGGAS
jgi:eukaryotic-like serine/threonine-protein kinase